MREGTAATGVGDRPHPCGEAVAVGVPVVGVVGGVGSGKSTVTQGLDGLSVHRIDADRIGHMVLDIPAVKAELGQAFGPVLNAEGAVDRKRLADRVFGESTGHQSGLETLNKIVRPAIRAEICRQLREYDPQADVILLDAALLLEGGWDAACDAIVFVDAADDVRQQRVNRNRGWTVEQWKQREAAQWPLSEKRRKAEYVISNDGPPEIAQQQMQAFLKDLLRRLDASSNSKDT